MYICKIRLSNFRNIKSTELSLKRGVSIICGKNGQGKTNLIEAAYLMSTPHSFRSSLNSEFISWGEEKAEIFTEVVDKLGTTALTMSFEKNKRKLTRDNNKINSLSEFIGSLITVCFAPSDVALVKGGEISRRQFLDKHLVDLYPSLLKALGNYHRALRSKNKILSDDNIERKMLTPWNHVMAKEGIDVQRAKYKFVEKISTYAASIYKDFSNDGCELAVRLKSDISENQSSEDFFAELERFATKEIARHRSVYGIHKDQLLLTLDGKDAHAFASQGQARSVALALKLAIVTLVTQERGESPVVLLDDIRSELDDERFRNLLKLVLSLNAQVILTTTEFDGLLSEGAESANLFNVEKGVVNQANYSK